MNNPVAAGVMDKAALLTLLRESRERFLRSFAGVSEEQSRQKPATDCWCVLETVEHLTAAETIQLKLISTQRRPRTADAPNREQDFIRMVPDRGHKMQAPEPARPCGRFATLAEATQQFQATRASVIQFVEQTTEDFRATEVKHPHPAAGIVSTFEMLVIMAMHAERHARQVEEIRKTLQLV